MVSGGKEVEAQHRTGDSFHPTMVLFHDSIERCTGTKRNRGPLLRIIAATDNGSGIRPTLLDGKFL